jgi:hypothetical protein
MKLRRCIVTWNNYNVVDIEDTMEFSDEFDVVAYFESLPHIKYFKIGFEVGEEESTAHLHAVVAFTQQKTFDTLRKYFDNNHIEKIINLDGALDYVGKMENVVEFGERPYANQGKRSDLAEMVMAIREGATNDELIENYPSQYFLHKQKVELLRSEMLFAKYGKEKREHIYVAYVSGSTGIGKTYTVYDNFGFDDMYVVTNYGSGMFDGYMGQDVLVLDEYSGGISINEMLIMLDIYPNRLRARYSDKVACYTKVIVISNKQFNQVFSGDHKQLQALTRRFKDFFDLDRPGELERYKSEMKNLANGVDAESLAIKTFEKEKVKGVFYENLFTKA